MAEDFRETFKEIENNKALPEFNLQACMQSLERWVLLSSLQALGLGVGVARGSWWGERATEARSDFCVGAGRPAQQVPSAFVEMQTPFRSLGDPAKEIAKITEARRKRAAEAARREEANARLQEQCLEKHADADAEALALAEDADEPVEDAGAQGEEEVEPPSLEPLCLTLQQVSSAGGAHGAAQRLTPSISALSAAVP